VTNIGIKKAIAHRPKLAIAFSNPIKRFLAMRLTLKSVQQQASASGYQVEKAANGYTVNGQKFRLLVEVADYLNYCLEVSVAPDLTVNEVQQLAQRMGFLVQPMDEGYGIFFEGQLLGLAKLLTEVVTALPQYKEAIALYYEQEIADISIEAIVIPDYTLEYDPNSTADRKTYQVADSFTQEPLLLPVAEVEKPESCTIEDCKFMGDKGQQYAFRIDNQLVGWIWLSDDGWTLGDGDFCDDWRECGLKLAQTTRDDLRPTSPTVWRKSLTAVCGCLVASLVLQLIPTMGYAYALQSSPPPEIISSISSVASLSSGQADSPPDVPHRGAGRR
jgi:hypothetical protein